MKDEDKTKKQLIDELNEMRQMMADYQKNADSALRESEKLYGRIIETTQEGIGILDAEDKITFANAKLCEMLGYEAEEILVKSILDFAYEENRFLISNYLLHLHNKLPVKFDFTFKNINGDKLYVIVNAVPIYNTKGFYKGSFAIVTDVTKYKQIENELRRYQQHLEEIIEERTNELINTNQELQIEIANRKQVEAALILSQDKFAKAFHQNPDLMSITTLEGRYVEINESFVEITGYERREVIGRTIHDLCIWVNPEQRDQIIEQVKENRSTRNNETQHRIKSGEIRTFNSAIDIVDINGIPRLLFTGKDITEHKRMEEALRLSEECLSKAFNTCPIMMSITTLEDGRVIKMNNAYSQSTGYNEEFAKDKTSIELGFWTYPAERDLFKQMIKDNKSVRDMEFHFSTSTGEHRLGLISGEGIDINGEPCIISVLMDITELRKMEFEMDRLDRLNLVGEMAASIGHEIRNPLTTIRGFIQFIWENENYQQEKDYSDLMIEEIDRANSIITEFLSLARDKMVELEPTDLNSIIIKLLPLIQPKALSHDQNIKLEFSDLPDLLLDKKEIRQLILNLVNNGLEAMSSPGNVTIRTFIEDEQVVLAVQDQGHGIENELMDKLGTPFLTTKEQGTGLGLAVCYKIAARHNARIDIDTGSAGTTFYVRFSKL